MRLRHTLLCLAILIAGCASDPARPDAGRSATSPAHAATSPSLAKISEFQGEYRFLSNFWPAEVEFEGIVYPSSEHAYQAAKSLDVNDRKKIAATTAPADAKKAGRALKLRADWDTAKFTVMETVVRYKFTHHEDLKKKLLDTQDAYLEEGNTWNDTTWGVYQGKGENHLGKILMKIRDELRHPAR